MEVANECQRPFGAVNGSHKNPEMLCPKHSILFVQYQAGAMGLNLQLANKIIYFSPPLSSELFEQSKKRIHRIGQKETCFYYYLVCKNSIEQSIYNTLSKRKDYTDKLFVNDI
jgi:SNF2 family DNA or RNA helicase